MITQKLTIPSLSGTFGIPIRLGHNQKMPKEPSNPFRFNTPKERQRVSNEINRLENNNGQRPTKAIFISGNLIIIRFI